MIRATFFLRLCSLTIVLSAGAVISYGQPHNDRLNYGTSLQDALKIEDATHAAWVAYFDKEEVDARTEYQLGILRCHAAVIATDHNAPCFTAASLKLQARMGEINGERAQENGDHRKHLIDIELHYRKPRYETSMTNPPFPPSQRGVYHAGSGLISWTC
jgi:hypothetical protein